MKTNSVRYLVEHVALRNALFSAGPRLILELMGVPGPAMVSLYNTLGKNEPEYECPYAEDSFTEVHAVFDKDNDSVLVIRIGMPAPEEALNCRAVYLCYGRLGGSNFYATSELTSDNTFFLCGWGEDNVHINFGDAPTDLKTEMEQVAELFWEINSDGYWEKLKGLCSGES